MRRFKYLFILFIFLLVGCTDYDATMEINKDKSMKYSITVLSDNDIKITDELKEKCNNYGYTVVGHSESDRYGIKIYKDFENIDDISLGERREEFNLLYLYEESYDEEKMFNLEKGVVSDRYSANFFVNLSDYFTSLEGLEITYKVYLPNGSVSDNADNVSDDGKELTWNITSLEKTDIDFVFELDSYSYIYYIIGIIATIFLILAIIGNLGGSNVANNKHEKNKQMDWDLDRKIYNLNKKNASELNEKYNNAKGVSTNGIKFMPKEDNETSFNNIKVDDKDNSDILTPTSNDSIQIMPDKIIPTSNDNIQIMPDKIIPISNDNIQIMPDRVVTNNPQITVNKVEPNTNTQVTQNNNGVEEIKIPEKKKKWSLFSKKKDNKQTNDNPNTASAVVDEKNTPININNNVNTTTNNPNLNTIADINYKVSPIGQDKFSSFDSSFVYISEEKPEENTTVEPEEVQDDDGVIIKVNSKNVKIDKNDRE